MPGCRVCLKPCPGGEPYHPACLESLFGSPSLPWLGFSLTSLMRVATEMAGKMSISGAQEKISLRLSDDESQLVLAPNGGRYILKPDPARFSLIPQNEHLTMCLAQLTGIEVPPFGLVELQGGAVAYLVKRFDRLDDGSKLAVEDFCQLAGKPIRDKYEGSGELCVHILRQYASEPLIEIRKLYQLLLFTWWVANGDHHLKNLSLFTNLHGRRQLTPAYDLVCTRLPIPGDSLALTIGGKKSNLTRQTWLDFAAYCQIPPKAAIRVLNQQIAALDQALILIRSSHLPEDLQPEYEQIVRANTEVLSQLD